MYSELKHLSKIVRKSGVFFSGFALGTVGLQVLGSKEAKKCYSYVLAKSFLLKDSIDIVVSELKQHSEDVLVDAKMMYEEEKKENRLIIEDEVKESDHVDI